MAFFPLSGGSAAYQAPQVAAGLVSEALPVALAISGERNSRGRQTNLFPIKICVLSAASI